MTPNPSVDRTVFVDRLERGALNRATNATAEAGGKGLNVSRALHTNGIDTTAVFPLAADSAELYLGLLGDAVPTATVPVAGSIRVNLSLLEPDGTVTKVNEPGPGLAEADAEALLLSAAAVPGAAWVVGCGSLPPGCPTDFYARLVSLRSESRRVAVDSSGPSLRAAVLARPDLVKPNLVELEELAGRTLLTLGDACDAAATLVADGIATVLVSLGADGALLVDNHGATHARADVDEIGNTVGAGDALLAGYLAGHAAAGGSSAALRSAVAWSAAAVRSRGTLMPTMDERDIEAVTVASHIERSRVLTR